MTTPDSSQLRFQGPPFGGLQQEETIFFYDEPLVFYCFDPADRPLIAIKLDDDLEQRWSSYLLCELSAEQLAASRPLDNSGIMAIARTAALRTSWIVHEAWDGWRCFKARRPSRLEIEDCF